MKNVFLLIISVTVLISCATDDDPTVTTCLVNGVTIFDEAPTKFVFSTNGADGYQLSTIVVYENTDSSFTYSYTYNGLNLNTITANEDGVNVVYTAVYDNDKLTKLTSEGGGNNLAGDLILKYSGSNVTSLETWAKASDGNLYQIGHYAMTYNGSGDLTKSVFNLDLVAVFTIAFGAVPSEPYAPAALGSSEYEYGQDDAPNPLYGTYYLENPDMGFMKNIPINMVDKDVSGSVIDSQSFTISFNEFGYPIKATSGALYIEVFYDCN